MITDKDQVAYFNFLCKTYDGLTRVITATKNRIQSLNPEMNADNYWILNGMVENKPGTSIKYQGLESIKGQVSRRIEKELGFWPVWSNWMEHIPGIGPFIAGNLILKYYYAFIPVCKDCGTVLEKKDKTFWCSECQKSVKGEGNLQHKLTIKDFPMISSWWHYMGRHNVAHCPTCRKILTNNTCPKCGKIIENPIYLMPKRQSGTQSDWSTPGRTLGFMIREAFNMFSEDHFYKSYQVKEKAKYAKRHPDWTKGHCHNVAWNNTVKLFLSHFWQVARTLDGLSVTEPYIVAKDPVHKIIPPFYWEGEGRKAA